MGSDRRISLAVRASAQGILDYSTYDYTAEWRKREELVFAGMYNLLTEEILRQKLLVDSSIISSKNYEAKDPKDFLARYYDLYNEYISTLMPWAYTKDNKTGKTASRAFVSSADKLIQRYKELFGNK